MIIGFFVKNLFITIERIIELEYKLVAQLTTQHIFFGNHTFMIIPIFCLSHFFDYLTLCMP